MSDLLPNFLHLGPSKSGSTWLHEVLICHPEIYLTEAKDLYYFSRCFDRGAGWYGAQFRDALPEHKIIGEFSPDYLACPEAAERIHARLGRDIRLMVTLREPASRAFSGYLYLRRHGLAAPTFRETLTTALDLLDEGRYGTHLRRYLRYFDPEKLHIALFDDLQDDPQAFVDTVTGWLGVDRFEVSPELLAARLTASTARWLPVAALAKHAANWVRGHDGAVLVGRIKRAPIVQRVLYKPLGADRPVMTTEDLLFVREQLEPEIIEVEKEFGIPLRQRWDW
jgi:Sulfotransferase domain